LYVRSEHHPFGSLRVSIARRQAGFTLFPYTTLFRSVADGGSLTLFASDYNGGMGFATGRTLTVTATFSDGSSAQAVTTVTSSAVDRKMTLLNSSNVGNTSAAISLTGNAAVGVPFVTG